MRVKRRHAPSVLLLLAGLLVQAMACPGEAAALLRRIRPLAFQSTSHSMDLARTPAAVGCRSGAATPSASFAAPVRLPVGAAIDGVSFYYTASAGAVMAQLLYFDTQSPDTAPHLVAQGSTPGLTPTPALASVSFLPGADLVVREGHRYMLLFQASEGAFVWEGRISYTP